MIKKYKFIEISTLIFIFTVILGLSFYKYFFKSWIPYYQEKLYKEPRQLLVKAINFTNERSNKNALDLGSGAGNETVFLLKKGWQVWSNDSHEAAMKIISSRNDIELYREKLTLIHANFVNLPWEELPKFDLIFAGYALPFVKEKEFTKLWEKIVANLSPQGLFVGNFFGPDTNTFNWWTKRKMTFLTKEKVLELFKDFTIELFEENYEKNPKGRYERSFDIIARKK